MDNSNENKYDADNNNNDKYEDLNNNNILRQKWQKQGHKNNIAEPCKHLAYGVSFESRNSPVHINCFHITFHQRNMFMSCMY